ncbi:MAG: hypothetical protein ACXABN_17755 [Candidatus Thorarchaeota archaeon]|jgi:hypothetical protein
MNIEQEKRLRELIRETLSIYATRRLGSTLGGFGRMFKLGVDYKNANTNIPQVRVGSVARYPEIPVKVLIMSNWDGQELYDELFKTGFFSDRVNVQPDRYIAKNGDLLVYGHAVSGDGVKVEVPYLVKTEVEKAVSRLASKNPDAEYKVRAELVN